MLEAKNVLRKHRHDNANQTKYNKEGQGQNNDKDKDKNVNVPALDFMMYGRCYCCGKVGHNSPNVGTKTSLGVNGSSIKKKKRKRKNKNKNKNKEKNKKNKHTYNQTLQVNQMKQLVLLPLQWSAINTRVSDGQIYRPKQRKKIKFPTFTMDLCRLSI